MSMASTLDLSVGRSLLQRALAGVYEVEGHEWWQRPPPSDDQEDEEAKGGEENEDGEDTAIVSKTSTEGRFRAKPPEDRHAREALEEQEMEIELERQELQQEVREMYALKQRLWGWPSSDDDPLAGKTRIESSIVSLSFRDNLGEERLVVVSERPVGFDYFKELSDEELKVSKVHPGSVAEKINIEEGWELVGVQGEDLRHARWEEKEEALRLFIGMLPDKSGNLNGGELGPTASEAPQESGNHIGSSSSMPPGVPSLARYMSPIGRDHRLQVMTSGSEPGPQASAAAAAVRARTMTMTMARQQSNRSARRASTRTETTDEQPFDRVWSSAQASLVGSYYSVRDSPSGSQHFSSTFSEVASTARVWDGPDETPVRRGRNMRRSLSVNFRDRGGSYDSQDPELAVFSEEDEDPDKSESGDSAPGSPSLKAMSTDMGMLDELSKSVTATKEALLRPGQVRFRAASSVYQPEQSVRVLSKLTISDIMELYGAVDNYKKKTSNFGRVRKLASRTLRDQRCRCYHRLREICKHTSKRSYFRFFFWIVILFNMYVIVQVANAEVSDLAAGGDSNRSKNERDLADKLEPCFLGLYLLEAIVNVLGVNSSKELAKPSLLTDLFLVAAGCLDLVLTYFLQSESPLRLLRVIRLFHIFRIVKLGQLLTMTKTFKIFFKALRSCFFDLLWVIVFLCIFNYAVAAFFTFTVGYIEDNVEIMRAMHKANPDMLVSALFDPEGQPNMTSSKNFYFHDTGRGLVTISGITLSGFSFGRDLLDHAMASDEWSATAQGFLVFYVVMVILWHINVMRSIFIIDLFRFSADSWSVEDESKRFTGEVVTELRAMLVKAAKTNLKTTGIPNKLSLEELQEAVRYYKEMAGGLNVTPQQVETVFRGLVIENLDRVDIDEFLIGLFKVTHASFGNAEIEHVDFVTQKVCQEVAGLAERYQEVMGAVVPQGKQANGEVFTLMDQLITVVDKMKNQLEKKEVEGKEIMDQMQRYSSSHEELVFGRQESSVMGRMSTTASFTFLKKDPWKFLNLQTELWMPTEEQALQRLETKFDFRSRCLQVVERLKEERKQFRKAEDSRSTLHPESTRAGIRNALLTELLGSEGVPWLRDRLDRRYQTYMHERHHRQQGAEGSGTHRSSLAAVDSVGLPMTSARSYQPSGSQSARHRYHKSSPHNTPSLSRRGGHAGQHRQGHNAPSSIGFSVAGLAKALFPTRGTHMGLWYPSEPPAPLVETLNAESAKATPRDEESSTREGGSTDRRSLEVPDSGTRGEEGQEDDDMTVVVLNF